MEEILTDSKVCSMNSSSEKNRLDFRRQTIFLRTFDQKIAGLRRENERLERLIANPKIRFSRSSLGGLYRIVNSLLSAGPMYGLDDIEAWAKKTRDWTVEMGKRGQKPTKPELEWLLGAIAELGDLRERAMERIREGEAGLEARDESERSGPKPAADGAGGTKQSPRTAAEPQAPRTLEKTAADARPEDKVTKTHPADTRDGDEDAAPKKGTADSGSTTEDLAETDTWGEPPAPGTADGEKDKIKKRDADVSPWTTVEETGEESPPSRKAADDLEVIEHGTNGIELITLDPGPPPETNSPPFATATSEKKAAASDNLPFTDEPAKRSVKEVAFIANESERKKKRDKSNTIPLEMEDLNEVSTAQPPQLPSRRNGVSPVWRIVALFAIAALILLSAYHFYRVRDLRSRSDAPIDRETVTRTRPPVPPEPDRTPPPAETPPAETPPAEAPPDPSEASVVKTEPFKISAEEPNTDKAKQSGINRPGGSLDKPRAETPKRDAAAEKERRKQRAKRQQEREEAAQNQKPAKPAEDTGTLVVKAPSEDVPVFVLVDGISRGKAPVRVKLKSGIHEVVFSANGRRAMRMVPIREDKTKTIDAKVP